MRVKPSDAKEIMDLLMGADGEDGANTLSEIKSLDAFAILNLPARLRKTAVELHRVGRSSAGMIADVIGEDEGIMKEYLEELMQMGFLRMEDHEGELFFSLE
jgi:hypothetical protein